MKYIANICETAYLDFTEKQFNDLQEKTVSLEGKKIKCKCFIIQNPDNIDFFILFPIEGFKKEKEQCQ